MKNNEEESWKPQNQSPNLNPNAQQQNASAGFLWIFKLRLAGRMGKLIIIRIEFPSLGCRISFKNEAYTAE